MSAVLDRPTLSSDPQAQAAAELLLRRQMRRDPVAYVQGIEIPGAPMTDDPDETRFLPVETSVAAHHRLLMRELELAAQTPYGRLMVFMPPGSAKSCYASSVFPTRFLGEQAGRRIILASYATPLALQHSRRARQVVKTRRYRSIYGAPIQADSRAAELWTLENGSQYLAAGFDAGITGNRADMIVIDDPIKNAEEAASEGQRNHVWEVYNSDIKSRQKPGCSVVLIQTRWHQDDLAGRILPETWAGESGPIRCRDGRIWRVLCIQAQAERDDDPLGRARGEHLWPEWFDRDYWLDFQPNDGEPYAMMKRRLWASLYQQVPSPDDGTFFRKEWFRTWREKPARLAIYGSSDYAVTSDGGDWTVLRIWGVDEDGALYRLAGWRGQTSSDVWIEQQCDLMRQWKPRAWFSETGPIRRAVEPALLRRMRETRSHCRLEWLPSISRHKGEGKTTGAIGFQARAAMGMVYLEQGADLTPFLQFPNGKDDHEVDAAAMIGRALHEAHPATKGEKVLPPKSRDDYDEAEAGDVDDWRVA